MKTILLVLLGLAAAAVAFVWWRRQARLGALPLRSAGGIVELAGERVGVTNAPVRTELVASGTLTPLKFAGRGA
jgi:hypothetical protein